MIANNSGSSHHTEKDLWLQVLALAKEIQDCKSYLYPKTLESIYDNIVRIEKLLDILLLSLVEVTNRHYYSALCDNLSNAVKMSHH